MEVDLKLAQLPPRTTIGCVLIDSTHWVIKYDMMNERYRVLKGQRAVAVIIVRSLELANLAASSDPQTA